MAIEIRLNILLHFNVAGNIPPIQTKDHGDLGSNNA
jgi:hypothetical protein